MLRPEILLDHTLNAFINILVISEDLPFDPFILSEELGQVKIFPLIGAST